MRAHQAGRICNRQVDPAQEPSRIGAGGRTPRNRTFPMVTSAWQENLLQVERSISTGLVACLAKRETADVVDNLFTGNRRGFLTTETSAEPNILVG